MDLSEYQKITGETAVYGDAGFDYTVFGLVSEVGEVANIFKRRMRLVGSSCYKLEQEDIDRLKDELGDVLWYLARTCVELGIELDCIAQANIDKLRGRKREGTLKDH